MGNQTTGCGATIGHGITCTGDEGYSCEACRLRAEMDALRATNAALLADKERLVELDRVRRLECVECKCALEDITTEHDAPHCFDGCIASEESLEEWMDAIEKLDKPAIGSAREQS